MENNIEHKANPEKLEQAMKAGNVVKVRKALKVEKISKIAKGKHELAKENRDEDSAKKRPEPVAKSDTPLSQLASEHKAAAGREGEESVQACVKHNNVHTHMHNIIIIIIRMCIIICIIS